MSDLCTAVCVCVPSVVRVFSKLCRESKAMFIVSEQYFKKKFRIFVLKIWSERLSVVPALVAG